MPQAGIRSDDTSNRAKPHFPFGWRSCVNEKNSECQQAGALRNALTFTDVSSGAIQGRLWRFQTALPPGNFP
jgi:hypothetical protein